MVLKVRLRKERGCWAVLVLVPSTRSATEVLPVSTCPTAGS